jgi:hypothetical protein
MRDIMTGATCETEMVSQTCFFKDGFKSVLAATNVGEIFCSPANLDAKISSDGSWVRIFGISSSQHESACFHNIQAFPHLNEFQKNCYFHFHPKLIQNSDQLVTLIINIRHNYTALQMTQLQSVQI